jgi:preprotein translocase subunit SecG
MVVLVVVVSVVVVLVVVVVVEKRGREGVGGRMRRGEEIGGIVT